MFYERISETIYKHIEFKKFDKLSSELKNQDLTGISLVSIVDVLVNDYGYSIDNLKNQGAIVDIEQLLDEAKLCLKEIQTNPGLQGKLTSLKNGLQQVIQFWKNSKLQNAKAEQFLNSQAICLMQTSPLHGSKEVDTYVTENIKQQMKEIYGQWLVSADSEQEI